MTKREQVFERIPKLVFKQSEKNDARNQFDKNVASKTQYDIVDMVLFQMGNLKIAARLHRHWISKRIIETQNIRINYIYETGNLYLV
jgi:hypothetical protein